MNMAFELPFHKCILVSIWKCKYYKWPYCGPPLSTTETLDSNNYAVMKLLNQRWLLIKLKSSLRICSTCRKHFPILSSFMTHHRVCNYSNTTGATSGADTAYNSGVHLQFSGVRVAQILVSCVIFCRSLFVLLSFFFWPSYCSSFWLPLLVSSNSSLSIYKYISATIININISNSTVNFPPKSYNCIYSSFKN